MILVTLSTFARFDRAPLDLLERARVRFVVTSSGKRITTPELLELGREATVVVAGVEPYDRSTLDGLPLLRCISRCGTGVDAIDLQAARERGIAVLNTPDEPVIAVAELTVGFMLALARQIPRQSRMVHEGRWVRLEGHLLSGRSVGLVGLGRIGRRVAGLLTSFGARVSAADPAADLTWCQDHDVTLRSFTDLLATSDIVSLHASASVAAPLRMGSEQLGSMKEGAILVNLARGGMVDDQALRAAIESGRLSGAALDVFDREPYDGPLRGLESVILTPHFATLTVETRTAMETRAVENALRFLRNELSPGDRVV